MAKRKVNKSQEIRDFVSANRSSSAQDVVDALKSKGIKVTTAMVANVKSKAGLTRGRRGRPRKTAAGLNGTRRVGEAKRFVAKVGSTQQALEVIRALEKLDSIAS